MMHIKLALRPVKVILVEYLSRSSAAVLALTGTIFLGSGLSILAPYYFSRLIDGLQTIDDAAGWLMAFWVYAALLGLSVAFQRGTQYLAIIQAEQLGFLASRAFFARLIAKKPVFFIDHNPTELQSAQAEGTQAIAMLAQILFIALLPGAATFFLTIATLWAKLNLEIVVVVVVYGTVLLALVVISNLLSRPFMEAAIDAGQDNARFVGNAIGMIEPLRQAGSARWMQGKFTDFAGIAFWNWKAYALRRIGFSGLVGTCIALQFSVTYFLLLPRFHAGKLSIGDIVLFNSLLLQLNVPFELVGQAIDETIRAVARMGPFARIWAAPEESDSQHGQCFEVDRGDVQFDRVTYKYINGRGISDLSFSAKRGQITFLTGETGSGKSTVFKLLLKAMDPEIGSISIDGTDIQQIPRGRWFSSIGVVPQEIMLLNDTLRTNIVLGRPIDDDRLRTAAIRASIWSRIQEMPDGFDTVVGERGLKLSGGERQRIAIARALYGTPTVLLLDEASSALDEATECAIMDQLRNNVQDITIIAITHRLNSIGPGDQIVEL